MELLVLWTAESYGILPLLKMWEAQKKRQKVVCEKDQS